MSFFLVGSNNTVIQIDGTISIARKNGNLLLILDKQLSTLKCNIENKKNNSTSTPSKSGICLNDKAIETTETFTVMVGDTVTIDDIHYRVFDNAEEVEKVLPHEERRKHKRPTSPYAPINFINFYCAPYWAISLYLAFFIIGTVKFIHFMRLEFPDLLRFLEKYHDQNLIITGIQTFFLVWGLSLLHSFLMYIHFNRNGSKRVILAFFYIIITISVTYWSFAPLHEMRTYIEIRDNIVKGELPEKSVLRKLNLLSKRDAMAESYKTIKSKLTDEESKNLTQDYELNSKRLAKLLKEKQK